MDQQRSNSRMETLVEEDEEEGNEQGESFDENGIKIPGLDKYNLRTKSIQNRLETEKRKRSPRKEPKPKQRPAPLSKYRRKTANARERTRMQVRFFFSLFNLLSLSLPPRLPKPFDSQTSLLNS